MKERAWNTCGSSQLVPCIRHMLVSCRIRFASPAGAAASCVAAAPVMTVALLRTAAAAAAMMQSTLCTTRSFSHVGRVCLSALTSKT